MKSVKLSSLRGFFKESFATKFESVNTANRGEASSEDYHDEDDTPGVTYEKFDPAELDSDEDDKSPGADAELSETNLYSDASSQSAPECEPVDGEDAEKNESKRYSLKKVFNAN